MLTLGARPPGLDRRRDKGSNGVQAVTGTYARRFGFNSKDTIYRGLKTLINRGLVLRTRDGWRSKTHFALYAVAWLPVTHRDGHPLDTPEAASDSWRTWKAAAPAQKKLTPKPTRKMVILQSDSRTQSGPMVGHDEGEYGPIMSTRLPEYGPMVGDTLRPLGGHTRIRSSKTSPKSPHACTVALAKNSVRSISLEKSPSGDPIARILFAIAQLPGYSDDEIARASGTTPAEVKHARQSA